MARITHKKSRRGCVVCKQRHVKCDETKPGCINCVTVHRRCPYLDEAARMDSTPPASTSSPPTASTSMTAIPKPLEVHFPSQVLENLSNVLALNKWMAHTYKIFCPTESKAEICNSIILNYALEFPFLMRIMLALATFHMSLDKSDKEEEECRTKSQTLMRRGLTDFSNVITSLNEENIVPAFIFSTFAGTCQFCHILYERDGGVEFFLGQLIECVTMLRGVQIVLSGWWEVIRTSQILKLLFEDKQDPKLADEFVGFEEDLENLRSFVRSSNFDSAQAEACEKAATALRPLYSEHAKDNYPVGRDSGNPALVWFMTMPADFHDLLLKRNPEALIVLAYLAPALHHRRNSWLVGNSGEILITSINKYLGPEWESQLRFPNKLMHRHPAGRSVDASI